jgi:hypothetical protein
VELSATISRDQLQTTRGQIQGEAASREAGDENVLKRAREMNLSGFGAAVVGTVLLMVGVCLELVANFI